jgi:hypothetical protein
LAASAFHEVRHFLVIVRLFCSRLVLIDQIQAAFGDAADQPNRHAREAPQPVQVIQGDLFE